MSYDLDEVGDVNATLTLEHRQHDMQLKLSKLGGV